MTQFEEDRPATGAYELRISLPAASRDDAMGIARRVWDQVGPYAESIRVLEEQLGPSRLVQCGSIAGAKRGD